MKRKENENIEIENIKTVLMDIHAKFVDVECFDVECKDCPLMSSYTGICLAVSVDRCVDDMQRRNNVQKPNNKRSC